MHSLARSPYRRLAAGSVVLYWLGVAGTMVAVMGIWSVAEQQAAVVGLGCPGRIASHSMAVGLAAPVALRFPLFDSALAL